jgi:glycosyltransferase involved in cell wall biosynthesis
LDGRVSISNADSAALEETDVKNPAVFLSVVIPHGGSSGSLRMLLENLDGQKCKFAFEVIVVANPPERRQGEIPKAANYELIREVSPRGANHARQRGAEVSRGEVILFLDDDCLPSGSDFLQSHVDLHEHHSELSGLGGPYVLAEPANHWGRTYHRLQKNWLDSNRQPGGDCVHLLGGNSSYKRQVFERHLLDVGLIFGGTEAEFQVRLFHQKMRLRLFDKLRVLHEGRESFADFVKKAFRQGLGAAYIHQRHQRPPRFVVAQRTEPRLPYWSWSAWIYRLSFEAGGDFFLRTGALDVSVARIYLGILRTALKKHNLDEVLSPRLWGNR